ncbi:MAG: VanW family protein [Acidimicrobiales bacterium]
MLPIRRSYLLAGGIPVAVLFLLTTAWAIDTAVAGDRVLRNVEADGPAGVVELGGLTADEVRGVAVDGDNALADVGATLQLGAHAVATDAAALGVVVDVDTLVDEALDARRGGFPLWAPFRWVGSFFSTVTIDVPLTIDEATADAAIGGLAGGVLDEPLEPSIDLAGGELVVIPGGQGAEVAPGALAAALPAMLAAGEPYEVTVELSALDPDLDTAELEAVAAQANAATSTDVMVEVLGDQAPVEAATLRSWVTLEPDGPTPTWKIDGASAVAALAPLFPELGSADQQARFDIVDGEPIIIPASESVVCCDDDTAERLKAGLLRILDGDDAPADDEADDTETDADSDTADGEQLPVIELAPSIADSDAGVAELEALGIIEEISTFTTNHNCCEGRVTNIQLMADMVRGHVIRPGERFDLNEVVGKRTPEKGFVPAGAIAQGVLEAQVGGGVSQFVTTIFNAAFFGGLDFVEYQSHSLYFSRYPRGREATISWPKPDFIIENNTPYGVLVWPTYTDTSITVTFYSTQNVDVSCVMPDGSLVQGPDACDDAVRWSSQGACTRNTTVRSRTFADGTTDEDSVFAVYRPGEGLDCAGNSTVPTTAPPETEEGTPDSSTPGDTTEGETTTTTAPPSSTTATTTAPPSSEGGGDGG